MGTTAVVGGGLALLGRNSPGLWAGVKNMRDKDLLQATFGIDSEDVAKAVHRILARGAKHADVFLEDALTTGLVMEDGKLRDVTYSEDAGVGLRAVDGDTQAFGYTQSFAPDELLRVAGQVAAVATTGQAGTAVIPTVPVNWKKTLYTGENPSVRLPAGEKLDILLRADKAARAYSPYVKRVDISLGEELRVIGLMTSYDRLFVDLQPMLRFNVTVVAEKGDKKQQGYAAGGGRMGLDYFDKTTPEDIAREAARIAVEMLDARPAPAGEQVVVLAPGDSGVLLHEAVGHGLEADFNRKGTSKYSGRIGELVASKLCTVIDEGLQPHSRGAIHIDDEGIPATRNVLIENGKLVSYMHDQISARHYGVDPTGNGRRQSYRHPPMPRMTNTYMLPGEATPEEVVASTKKGIYCKTFSGGQVNISNGDFVFQVTESYLIEDGKMTAPLKDVVIIGNGPDALGKVSMVGSDLVHSDGRWTCGKGSQRVPVGVGISTVRVDGITVGGTAQ
jgi:TldD protein